MVNYKRWRVYAVIGVNSSAGNKGKDKDGNWDQTDDRTYQDGCCADG